MKRSGGTRHQSGVRLEPTGGAAGQSLGRRIGQRWAALDRQSGRATQALALKLRSLKSDYRRSLNTLMGPAGLRRYRALRRELAAAPRARRIRAANTLLDEIGFDRPRALRLKKAFLAAARELVGLENAGRVKGRPRREPPRKSPWVTYTAPYANEFWSYTWTRSDEPDDPVLARYLDRQTGNIGSSIEARVSGADDDDDLSAEYYTCLQVGHTALATGQLECYLALAFNDSAYSGDVSDEFGFSDATFSQFALARFRLFDGQGSALETQDSRIYNMIDTDWGDGVAWSNFVSMPGDLHWYHFKTAASVAQGTPLVLEAGISHQSWFWANDESIRLTANLDLRLDRIQVRSIPG